MDIILKKTKEVPFYIEQIDDNKIIRTYGKFICKNPSASDFVSFWAEFRNVEGSEKEKASKQAELVTNTFKSFVEKIVFDTETKFKDEAGNELDALSVMSEYFSILLYQKGIELLNPSFTGAQSDPLESSSAAS